VNSTAKKASVAGAVVACSVAAVGYGIRAPSSQLFAPSIYRGSGDRRSIALTFDDGPSPGTAELLKRLADENVRATFFQCGINVVRNPELARQVLEAGHEIGNHTFTHIRLCPRLGWQPNFVSPSRIYQELADTQEAIATATGAVPRWFRAPYGMRWFGLRTAQRRLNLTGAYWTVIGHDWEWDAEHVTEHVIARAAAGGIVCMHDGRDSRKNPDISVTIEAVMKILPRLRAMGFSFETVSEIATS
jgi:peptidoglycan-N-acetylglucosamine deacetylase